MKNPLFPELPEDISGLSDEELQAKLDEHRAVAAKIQARDPEVWGEREVEDVIKAFEDGVAAIERITAQQGQNAADAAETTAHLDDLFARSGVTTEDVADAADGEELK